MLEKSQLNAIRLMKSSKNISQGHAMKNLILGLLLFLGVQMDANTSQNLVKYYELKNVKIPVISEVSHMLPTGFIQLAFIGGGNISDGDKIGLSKISTSLLNEGTKELGATKFSELLEERAIGLSTSSGLETLNIELNYLKDEQNKAIKLLGELLKSPNLTETTLKKIQTRAITNLLNKQNDFDYIANTELSTLLFKNTPLKRPALGTIKSIKNIKIIDIKNYLQENLVLKKLVIIMGGDIDIDETLESLKPILSILSVGKESKKYHYEVNNAPQEKTVYKSTQQAYIYFGSPFQINDLKNESYKAKVLGFVLGSSGFGSRLMEEIRVKRGLAYSAYLRVVTGKIISYTTGLLQTQLQNQDESIALVKKVINDFTQKGITQRELDDAKNFLLGSEPLRRETLSQRLSAKFYNYYLNLPLDFNEIQLDQIKNLTLKEINDYIYNHLEIKNLSFAIVTQKPSSQTNQTESEKEKK